MGAEQETTTKETDCGRTEVSDRIIGRCTQARGNSERGRWKERRECGARERRKEADRLLPVGSMGVCFRTGMAAATAATAAMRK
ncbi:unnamed protein product [Sphagnum jensenii]|jgi:hypothetical protein|uniref:Uncharacterized protein n=1 Tax=Sphagnum jensenii TaxID=128206 RepID=A0ABP0VM73_9BRYO